MQIEITEHAKERMLQYNVTQDMVLNVLNNPHIVVEGYVAEEYTKRN